MQKDAAVAFERMDLTSAEKLDEKSVEKKQAVKEIPGQEKKSQMTKEESKGKTDDEGFTKVEKGKKENKPQAPTATNLPHHDCDLCKGKHWLTACPDFRKKSVKERLEFCESKRICNKCLRWSHRPETCRFEGKCFVCQEGHNTMLHGAKDTNTTTEAENLLDLLAESEASGQT